MSTAHRIRARNVRSGVLIVSDAAMLTLSDAQQYLLIAGRAGVFCAAGVGDSIVMTGADGAASPGARPGWQWDVALSFAGAQRPYVEQVASALKARGVRCFYDADEQIDLWGKYLAEELPAIYGEQAAAVVVFVSAEYAARDWTRLERRAALNRAVRERQEYVLPARFDDTPLPGLLSDMVAVDLRGRTPQQFAAMIADKLARLAITGAAGRCGRSRPGRGVGASGRGGARGGRRSAAARGACGDQRARGAR